jgi:hypothetical protein
MTKISKNQAARMLVLRNDFLRKICSGILGFRKDTKIFSNADSSSQTSTIIAEGIANHLPFSKCDNPPSGQTAGTLFCECVKQYIESAFTVPMQHIRPGEWVMSTSQGSEGIAAFSQYRHLADLDKVLKEHKILKTALGSDYLITPDIVIARKPISDETINSSGKLLAENDELSISTPLRARNHKGALDTILHASISCKWTMRSDRAQNSRTEALNLMRNRKGNAPHIVAVTFEPMPTRLASIAMGTGDIDCTYHGALYELKAAIEERKFEDQAEMLNDLIVGNRLRDISDLPFDLSV